MNLITVNQSNFIQGVHWLKQNAPTESFMDGSSESDWATGTAREKVARERRRMVLMNIIVFVTG
jgi:hypothetical protein